MTDRRPDDDRAHPSAAEEEWVFTAWLPDGSAGLVSGYRRPRDRPGWYWASLARAGVPLLHVSEWEVPPRSDPLLVKAYGLWADHVCEQPLQQWTVANETFAVAFDQPTDALGRGYGTPSALAFDLEWYAVGPPLDVEHGYVQDGVVHGIVELAGGPLRLEEVPGRRWHRWGSSLAAVALPDAYAHTGVRAVFRFPDGTIADWVVTPDGWRNLTARPEVGPVAGA